jgi:hypothetical protein
VAYVYYDVMWLCASPRLRPHLAPPREELLNRVSPRLVQDAIIDTRKRGFFLTQCSEAGCACTATAVSARRYWTRGPSAGPSQAADGSWG